MGITFLNGTDDSGNNKQTTTGKGALVGFVGVAPFGVIGGILNCWKISDIILGGILSGSLGAIVMNEDERRHPERWH